MSGKSAQVQPTLESKNKNQALLLLNFLARFAVSNQSDMSYQVSVFEKLTIIADTESAFRMMVGAAQNIQTQPQTAYGKGTLYQVKGGFTPVQVFNFIAVNKQGQPLAEIDIAVIKAAMDFFFTSILDSELYVKEFPQESSLFEQEASRVFGTNKSLAA